MNIVFDEGLCLEDRCREMLAPLLPAENAPLRLSASTSKTDGTPRDNEGMVFLTNLPVDVLKYHSDFFQRYKSAPQWFFILLNRSDHGLSDLKNAARKIGLKNCTMLHAGSAEAFEKAVKEVAGAKHITRGKALFLTKHSRGWPSELARLLYGEDDHKYDIMDSSDLSETDAETLLLCGETMSDFKGVTLPGGMEPYFVFRFKDEIFHYIVSNGLVEELAGQYHMTTERARSRLYFVDLESEWWLTGDSKPTGEDAVNDGILLWDRFGLPVSRREYSERNIAAMAQRAHKSLEEIKQILM